MMMSLMVVLLMMMMILGVGVVPLVLFVFKGPFVINNDSFLSTTNNINDHYYSRGSLNKLKNLPLQNRTLVLLISFPI